MAALIVDLTYISGIFYLDVVHAFDVLGDPVRRRILELLADGEMSAGAVVARIQVELAITQPVIPSPMFIRRRLKISTSSPTTCAAIALPDGSSTR